MGAATLRLHVSVIALGVVSVACDAAHSQRDDAVEQENTGVRTTTERMQAESLRSTKVTSVTTTTTCEGEATQPERIGDEETIQSQFPDFPRLYDTGEFGMGYCVAEAIVTEEGRLSEIRVVRPKGLDRRVREELRRTLETWRFKPGTLCGRPVDVTFTVGFGHCPVQREAGTKEPG